MAKDDPGKKSWLPKIKINKHKLAKQAQQVEGATIRHTRKFIFRRLGSVREAQRHIITWIVIMCILIAATGLQLMWFRQNYLITAGATNGLYAEAVKGPLDTLNPLFASSSAEQSAGYLMFSRLVNYDTTGHLNYDLATDITPNNEHTVYTVKIKDNAYWHDGSKLTANDIAFTVDLIKNPETRSVIEGWSNITVKVIDDYTVEFSVNSAYAAFEHVLNFPILPKHLLASVAPSSLREDIFSNKPVGSGPFKFNFIQEVNQESGKKNVYMTNNGNYYNGEPKVNRFQLNIYNTTDEIKNAILNGEVNAAADLYPSDISDINDKKYDIESNPVNSGVYAIFNTTGATLKDIALRQALQLGTNTDKVRQYLPTTTPQLDLPVTNSQLSGNLPKAPKFDFAAASKKLDEAGWVLGNDGLRSKDGVKLKLSVVTIKNTELERAEEILTGQWRSLGISIDTKVFDPSDVAQGFIQNVLQPRSFDVLIYQLNIGGDPDVFAYWHSSQASTHGSNFANYSNAISDDALISARSRSDSALRNAKYITFAKQWLADVPAIGLYQQTAQYVSSNSVKSVSDENILISLIDRYNTVLEWTVGTKTVYKTP